MRYSGFAGKLMVFILIAIIPLILVATLFFSPALTLAVSTGIICLIVGICSFRTLVCLSFGCRTPETVHPRNYPFVSVIVSAYNEETVLPRTMASMREVGYPSDRLEFLYVYEETCTDRTEEIIAGFEKADPRFHAMKFRGGKAVCLNYAIRQSRGDVVCILDADHSLEQDAIIRAVGVMETTGAACVKGRSRVVNKRESVISLLGGVERDVIERLISYGTYLFGGFSFFGGSLGFFRRELLETVGPFNGEVLTEDIELSARIHLAGYTVCVDPSIVSWEETPPTFAGWWKQRKRWCRGWVQCTVIHLFPMIRSRIPVVTKVDSSFTWALNFIPLLTISFIPLSIIGLAFHIPVFLFNPALAVVFAVVPVIMVTGPVLLDVIQGERFRWEDLFCIILFPYYLALYGIVAVSAILDEFILEKPSVFIRTEKSGSTRAECGPVTGTQGSYP
jgi:cellulose synthase/poly-beta-1,6-N-acetylglucosamine synthase-like glycosyltransferase